jgi:hypothetical protein
MNERRRLECVPRFFLRQAPRGEPAQLVVDQRQKLIRGVWFALLDRIQNARDFTNGNMSSRAE